MDTLLTFHDITSVSSDTRILRHHRQLFLDILKISSSDIFHLFPRSLVGCCLILRDLHSYHNQYNLRHLLVSSCVDNSSRSHLAHEIIISSLFVFHLPSILVFFPFPGLLSGASCVASNLRVRSLVRRDGCGLCHRIRVALICRATSCSAERL